MVMSMAMAFRASQEWLRLIRDSEPEMTTPVLIDPSHLTAWIRMMIASAFHPQVFRKAHLTGKDLSLGEANGKLSTKKYQIHNVSRDFTGNKSCTNPEQTRTEEMRVVI